MMENILRMVDKALCAYLGLEKNEIVPHKVKIWGSHILISSTESFKRHVYIQPIDEFNNVTLNNISSKNKEKLGLAIGKAMAKNLIISFDELLIKNE